MSPYYSKEGEKGENWTKIEGARTIKDADELTVGTVTPLSDDKIVVSIYSRGNFMVLPEKSPTLFPHTLLRRSAHSSEQDTNSVVLNGEEFVFKSIVTTKEASRIIFSKEPIK